MKKTLHIVLDQQSDNNPSVKYQDNQLGFAPVYTRNFEGLCTINLQSAFPSCEGRLFAFANTIIRYSDGVENPVIIGTTTISVNDVDGEIYIENRVNGVLADGFSGLQIFIGLKE